MAEICPDYQTNNPQPATIFNTMLVSVSYAFEKLAPEPSGQKALVPYENPYPPPGGKFDFED